MSRVSGLKSCNYSLSPFARSSMQALLLRALSLRRVGMAGSVTAVRKKRPRATHSGRVSPHGVLRWAGGARMTSKFWSAMSWEAESKEILALGVRRTSLMDSA